MINICILRALFASVFVIGKQSLNLISPIFLVGSRMFIAGVILLTWYWIRHRNFTIQKKDMSLIVQIAFFRIFVAYVFDTMAAQYVSSYKWALIWTFIPFITALFSKYFLKEKFGRLKLIALVFGIIGFIPILFITSTSSDSSTIASAKIPEFVMVLTMISYAYGWILTKKIVNKYEAVFINGSTMLLGGAAALIGSFIVEPSITLPHCSTQQLWLWTGLGVLSLTATYQLYVVLLRKHSATFISFASLLDPIFVSLFTWFAYNQHISWYFFISVIFLSIGLYIFYQAEKIQDNNVQTN